MKNIIKNKFTVVFIALVIGALIGWVVKPTAKSIEMAAHDHVESVAGIPLTYTCSMHPQIRQNGPGDCPICGMDLIPLDAAQESTDPASIAMSPTAMQLAGVQTMVVGAEMANKTVRLNGKVQIDERLLYTQASHIPGRIEKLMVNFTGEYIEKGQTIALIYSPELVTAQEELIQAAKYKQDQPALFNAATAKLKNWKVSESQIEEILKSREIVKNFPIKANVSGFVSKKLANYGDHLTIGQAIYEVSNLSKVWVLLDIYESELPWIKLGDQVSFTVQSLPGETFKGKINYVDPIINPTTRVAQARIEMENSGNKFKPEMFVSGVVTNKVTGKGESLVVPKTAVLWTGKRSIVYVQNVTDQAVTFQLREVTLGPALGDEFIIESGLGPGEEIAVNGTFSIDAAAQLAGKPSMMSLVGNRSSTGHSHSSMEANGHSPIANSEAISKESKGELKPIFDAYFTLKDALTNDDLNTSKSAAKNLQAALSKVDRSTFKSEVYTEWMKYDKNLTDALENLQQQKTLSEIRTSFQAISDELVAVAERFDPYPSKIYIQHCPMAKNNEGADWLSLSEEIRNPYFGGKMLKCGSVTERI